MRSLAATLRDWSDRIFAWFESVGCDWWSDEEEDS